MNPASLSFNRNVGRKKIKSISLLATIAGQVVFRPKVGESYILTQAFVKNRTVTGTVTTAPHTKLTNGTTDTVADVAQVTTANTYQRLAVVGNVVIDSDNPLTLVVGTAQVGGTVFLVDLIVALLRVSD